MRAGVLDRLRIGAGAPRDAPLQLAGVLAVQICSLRALRLAPSVGRLVLHGFSL
jgi:hypothetical protein